MTYEQGLALTGETWTALEDGEKVEVLQSIENHMAAASGRMACPVEGRFLYTGNDGVALGSYDPKARTIYVNTSQFDPDARYGKTAQPLVTACLHEGRHALQHQVADGLVPHDDPRETALWRENLAQGNYVTFQENPRAYYDQPVEADARRFAQERYAAMEAERARLTAETAAQTARDAFERQMQPEEQDLGRAAAAFQSNAPALPAAPAEGRGYGIR